MTGYARRVLPAISLAMALAGCSTIPSFGTDAPKGRVIDTSVQSFRPIAMSRNDTCPTQRAIAAHNSVYQTIKTGKVVAYRAPCDADEAGKSQSKPPPATS